MESNIISVVKIIWNFFEINNLVVNTDDIYDFTFLKGYL